jgi:CoA:oxalate CoA-transferase
VPGIPIRFSDTPLTVRRPPPLLAQHADEILREVLGRSEEEVAELRATGALGPVSPPA